MVQAKPRIGAVDDPLEREADRAADAAMRGDAVGSLAHAPAGGAQDSGDAAAGAVAAGGASLSPELRRYFEPRFGRSFAGVRIHDHPQASEAAAGLDASAFTLGSDIGFAAGRFAPHSVPGRRLLAHELAHVAQGGETIRRAPANGKDEEPTDKPGAPLIFDSKDLLAYPLFVDLWNDIFAQKLTKKQKKEFELKGKEGMAVWNLLAGLPLATQSPKFDATVGDFLGEWLKHSAEIHKIAGGDDFYQDLFSRFVGINIQSYLGSELFQRRLKAHTASLLTVFAFAQATLSTVQAVRKPSAEEGEFEATQAEKQTLLVKELLNLVLKEQIKAPDFFAFAPLKLATHPAYAASSATAGGGPNKLIFEKQEGQGEGQGGDALKLGLTLNLPQIVGMFREGAPPAKDVADLQKYRGWQGSLWFNYNRTDPTKMQEQAGKLPSKDFHLGTLFGGGGHLMMFEGGRRYGGAAADEMTAWFLRGGYGYSGKTGARLQKIGFTATYTDWVEQDILAPRLGEGGTPVGGWAAQLSPFAKVEFGKEHKFSAGAALNFVTGGHENFGLSGFRGDLSYTYMGDTAEGQLPAFKLDLAGSADRLDWWNPDSPLLAGAMARVNIRNFFAAGQVNFGAAKIPEARSSLIEKKEKMPAPTAVMFSLGSFF